MQPARILMFAGCDGVHRVLIAFAAMSPLGILFGWLLDALTTGIFQVFVSAGMFAPYSSILAFNFECNGL
jgi:hypothetical protein